MRFCETCGFVANYVGKEKERCPNCEEADLSIYLAGAVKKNFPIDASISDSACTKPITRLSTWLNESLALLWDSVRQDEVNITYAKGYSQALNDVREFLTLLLREETRNERSARSETERIYGGV